MCLRPCPEEHITAPQVSIAKISCERLLLLKTCVTMRKNCLLNHSYYPHWESGPWIVFYKRGLHIVVTVAEYACDDASKRIIKLSTHPLQAFLVGDQYLWSLQRCGDKVISGGVKKHVRKHLLAILTTYMEIKLKEAEKWTFKSSQKSALLWLKSHNYSWCLASKFWT